MINRPRFSRRKFLSRASLGAAALTLPAWLPARLWAATGTAAPNSRITLGFIGMGTQNRHHLGLFLGNKQTQVVAVCDVDTDRRERARKNAEEHYAAAAGQSAYQGCAAYNDFRELLARRDIDAVVIATPDHWHALQAIMAADAGKDIYCEKPLCLTIREAREMVNAARRNQRIFQTGSQQRSSPEFLKACELVRNGRIGELKEIYVSVGGPSKWCDLPAQTPPAGLDWERWLGPAPYRAYNEVLSPRGVHGHFPNWRGYREYSGGGMTDWGAHHFDIAQWGLGMDHSGPVEIIPPDGREVKRLIYRYANGVIMHHGGLTGYAFGVVFVGTKGKIGVDRGKFMAEPAELGEAPLGADAVRLYKSRNHHYDWLECVRSRKTPICDVEIGCRTVTVCHLGNLAYWYQRPLRWDPAKERFLNDDEANTWLDRPRRAPWTL